MKETLIVIGLIMLAVALRSCRSPMLRKSGALLMLVASFFLFYFLTGYLIGGLIGVLLWFCLPWVELLTRVKNLRLPMNNRLRQTNPPRDTFFPHAAEAIAAIQERDFEHVEDRGWSWAGMDQHFRIFWNPELNAIATVCLCEQEQVAFAFITLSSHDKDGTVWRTTNFPFSATLKTPDRINWNRVPCEQSSFDAVLRSHTDFLAKKKVQVENLYVPSPEVVVEEIESEMNEQLEYNLQSGIIEEADPRTFRYTTKGLFFLWKQLVRDMVRLC